MKALVTGATGFIGSHLVDCLLDRGDEVSCLTRNPSHLRWLNGAKVKVIRGDCADPDLGRHIGDDFDWVFHLAGLTKTLHRSEFYRINGNGTANLATLLAQMRRAPRLIYLSSLAAAGPSRNGHPLREPETPQPVSDYGRSKLEGEKALVGLGGSIPWLIVRAPVIYGPRDRGLLPFFKLAKRGVAFGFGGIRDLSLCYVDDLVRGLRLAAERGRPGEIYYVAEEAPRSWKEILDAIAEALGVRPLTIPSPTALLGVVAAVSEGIARVTGTLPLLSRDKAREMREAYWVCDPAKAGQDLGFATTVPLRTGAQRAVDWYKSYGWL